MTRLRAACSAAATLVFYAASLVAQNAGIRVARTQMAMRVDGRLDEAAWLSAEPITHFVQIDPDEGQPASERTEVRLLLSGDGLYVGARMYDRQIALMHHRLGPRDDRNAADAFAIELDALHDHIHGVRFQVNSAGTMADGTVGPLGATDYSWDAVWEAATSVDSVGWTAELRIPLSQLRFDRTNEAWGIQLERFLLRRLERSYAVFTPKAALQGGAMSPAYYGTLTGIGDLPVSRGVEFIPYVAASALYLHDAAAGPLLQDPHGVYGRRIGADARVPLSAFTLTATANPDFGQVEVDPAVVNLTAFETTFPEKRPFFLESADRFGFANLRNWWQAKAPSLFYSRRIGRQPHLSPFGDTAVAYASVPGQTDILGAAKLVGHTMGGWTVGMLDAVTDRATARTLSPTRVSDDVGVEPATNYFVERATRDLRGGQTTLGSALTAVHRRLDDTHFRSGLARDAYAGGFDMNHSWSERRWALDASVAASRVAGDSSAIALLQQSSARYFERPDGLHDRFDPARRTLTGYDSQLSLARLSGNWVGSVVVQDVSPEFETNDVGVLRDAGRRALSLDWHYQDFTPGERLQRFIIWPYSQHIWNYDGQLVSNYFALFLFGEWRNRWKTGIEYDYSAPTLDDRLTRGGPVARAPARDKFYFDIESPDRGWLSASTSATVTITPVGGATLSWQAGANLRPRPGLRIEVDPTVGMSRDAAQFVARYADQTATATYGQRTVFARLDQRSLGAEGHVDWIVTPRLSVQGYAQELIVASPFSAYKALRAPRTYEFDEYGAGFGTATRLPNGATVIDADGPGPAPAATIARPDFTVRSTRLNAVLRWEFRAGSSVFVVWQHSSGTTTDVGTLDTSRDVPGLFAGRPDNVLALKLTYWLAR